MEMNKEDKKYWLGATLCLCGVALLFVSLFLPPVGEISDMVLWGAGEIFTLAGGLLGLDAYFDHKIKKFIDREKKDGDSL